MKKKIRKIFAIDNWLWKSDLGTFWRPIKHLWKSNQKIIFLLLILLLKWSPCWLTSAKLHYWGHTNLEQYQSVKLIIIFFDLFNLDVLPASWSRLNWVKLWLSFEKRGYVYFCLLTHTLEYIHTMLINVDFVDIVTKPFIRFWISRKTLSFSKIPNRRN